MAVAYFFRQCVVRYLDGSCAIVEDDEIVAAARHFEEWNIHRVSEVKNKVKVKAKVKIKVKGKVKDKNKIKGIPPELRSPPLTKGGKGCCPLCLRGAAEGGGGMPLFSPRLFFAAN